MLITAKMNRKFGACYSDAVLKKLYGNGKTPEQVATLTDGLWADMSDRDRCWILWRVIATKNKDGMRECLARMLERVLPANCDPRSRAVVEAIRQDAVTDEIIAAAAAAASAAYAASLAYAAGRASVYAAYAADAASAARAAYAACAAARAAYEACAAAADAGTEMEAQIADILQFLF